ncbi:MAG: twin-arginine translocase TatA/TatE family subunit [Ignavibacteria bacterium]|nr:twin-arginine translocase TatA/TatE family subunit [Ignavibacteria bacterium]
MFGLGPTEIIIIVLIIVILFGAKKIPELMGGIGKGIKEFKKAATNDEPKSEVKDYTKQTDNNEKK